jgi:hypothetical protein
MILEKWGKVLHGLFSTSFLKDVFIWFSLSCREGRVSNSSPGEYDVAADRSNPAAPARDTMLNYGRADSQYAIENEYVPPCPGNPFITLVSRPRETLQWIIGTNPQLHVVKIIIVGGVIGGLESAFDKSDNGFGGGLSIGILLGVPVSVLFSILGLYLMGWLTRVAGGWLGGTGSSERCRAALAWGQVPSLACSVAILPIVILLWFVSIPQTPRLIIALGLSLLQLAIGIYAIVIISIGLGVAHRFNAWMGFATSLIAGAIVIACVAAIVVPIVFLFI